MKRFSSFNRAVSGGLVLFSLLCFVGEAGAQLNERRVFRDATGVYSGVARGGRLVQNYNDPGLTDETETIPPESGKVRIPVKEGRLSSKVRDEELPGNDAGTCTGKARRADVLRGGRRVVISYQGKAKLDESGHGPWNGQVAGNLDDKGAKWLANTKSGAKQVNVNVPQPNTKTVSRLGFRGRG